MLRSKTQAVHTAGTESGVEAWRAHFPALDRLAKENAFVYLDTAATSHRAREVINAIADFYAHDNANPSATLHAAARRANDRYEQARATVARFIGADDPLEVVFTRGTTEAINLVAAAWGSAALKPGDEILIGLGEHASNMLPWQRVAARAGAIVRYFDLTQEGHIDTVDFESKLSSRTRLVAFSQVSNVLGVINPVEPLVALAHTAGALVLIDGAQSVPHLPVNVSAVDCDFLAFSSHKMCGPLGIGVLWARRALLEAMPPYQLGSNMAHDVGMESAHPSDGALKYGAGTPNVSGAVGLAAAMDFLSSIGPSRMRSHEQDLTAHAVERLRRIDGVTILGSTVPSERVAVFSFTVAGMAPVGVATALDARGIAVRAGDLASLPLLERFGVRGAVRASCYLYTTLDEIDRLANALEEIVANGA